MKYNVVFDLGGVLVDWDPRHLYRKLLPDEETVDLFLQKVCSQEWNVQQDKGRSFEDGINERVALFPEDEHLIRAYFERWPEMLGGPIEGSVEILSELKQSGFPVYALSNWSAETYPLAKKCYAFLQWFRGEVISGQVGMIKPQPEIYRHLLKVHGLKAGETLFIDDRQENVDAAANEGIHGILFHNPGQLRKDLASLGIP
ncbi:uncharacterized protein METZ01_LOCUS399926 [marine metagenome]|uniref:Uncharacterized protein n=1 Tax=marine metagenome TaxID=408172 RepID=A0A382VKL9_9ZZZZ